MSQLDSLRHVLEEALQIHQAVDVKKDEWMFKPHVIKALFDTLKLFITEHAASLAVQGGSLPVLIYSSFFSFFKSEVSFFSLLLFLNLLCVFQIIQQKLF